MRPAHEEWGERGGVGCRLEAPALGAYGERESNPFRGPLNTRNLRETVGVLTCGEKGSETNRLDALTTDLLPALRRTSFVGRGSCWLEIIVVVGIRRLGRLGVIPGYARWELSDGVVLDVVREGRRERANGSMAVPSGLHAV